MENQLTPITIARLEAAGFEADGADKLTRAYKLNTKWQTVTIFHQYLVTVALRLRVYETWPTDIPPPTLRS